MESATEAATVSGLRYVSDSEPGIRRETKGKGFRYIGVDGKTISNPQVLERIKSLVIPPAWADVWICVSPQGHLQATGRDARGRKQFKYHPRWREVRDHSKYARLPEFAQCLKKIRRQVRNHLKLKGLPKEKVLATVVQLLESTQIRVGNEEYAKQNNSYGLTTMRVQHVKIQGAEIKFQFKGKSGIRHAIQLQDRRLARIVKQCQDLPGQELFQYVDDQGEQHSIGSADVNDYIREISGADFTAKDFRTWAGTLYAVKELQQMPSFQSETEAKQRLNSAIKVVAQKLGNTKTVCRKCYVHPAVIEAYLNGQLLHAFKCSSNTEENIKNNILIEKHLGRFLKKARSSHHKPN